MSEFEVGNIILNVQGLKIQFHIQLTKWMTYVKRKNFF